VILQRALNRDSSGTKREKREGGVDRKGNETTFSSGDRNLVSERPGQPVTVQGILAVSNPRAQERVYPQRGV